MTTGKALNGKPYAGNPHVAPSQCYGGTGRFDEGEVASAATPRRGSLLYKVVGSFQRAFALGICAAAAFLPSFADTNITENVTLTEDADWTSHGTVNLSGGVVVDLNGHDLRIGGLAGEGRFVSSADELIVNGSFEQIEGATGTHQDFSETVYPTGWTTANANLATVGWAASRDTIWSKNFDAQNGNKFVFWWCNDNTRGGASLTQKVEVVKADVYRLSFYTAYRPGSNVYKNMRIHVDVDGNTLGYAVCSTAAWTESSFDVLLDVGEHSVTFRSDGTGGGTGPCGLLDNVSLRRRPNLRLGQSAGGTYSSQNISVDGNVIVLAESQALNGDCDWSGLGAVNIAAGATIDLAGHDLAMNGLTYDIAARMHDSEFIANGSFETLDGSNIESWEFNQPSGNASVFSSGNWCGSSKAGSRHVGFWINKNSHDGATISQTVDVPVSKTYRLSCWTKLRSGYPAITLDMAVDGIVRRSVTCPSSWQEVAVDVDLAAGEHEVSFTSSGYNATTPGGGIDLVSLRVVPDAAITNSNNETVSELRANFASGWTANDRIALGGNLQLVKEGAGTFASHKAQTYTGGTVIAAGMAQPPDPASQDDASTGAKFPAFGTGSITVAQDAVFDIRANYDYNEGFNAMILDGGALRNGKWQMTHTDWGGVGISALMKDSSLQVWYTTILGRGKGTLDLGTHKLSATMSNGQILYVTYPVLSNGTFAVSGIGWARFDQACDIDARFEVNSPIAIMADLRVRDYVVTYGGGESSGDKALNVYGTFRPDTDMFYGCTMLDKSTIDLSGRTTALPAEAVFAKYQPSRLSVSFEEGATVTVHVDGRTDLKELSRTKENGAYAGYLMKWNTRPDASVKFVLDGDAARRYRLLCTDGGLVLCPSSGLEIVVR